MRTKYFLALIFIISVNHLYAQKKVWFGVDAGIAVPVGAVASKSGNMNNNGYAKSGATLSIINFGYSISDNWGVCVRWMGAMNDLDGNKLIADNFKGRNIVSDFGAWYLGGIMAGAYYKRSGSPFLFRAMLGSGTVNSPYISIRDIDAGPLAKEDSRETSVFIYSLGIGGNFNLSKRFLLITGVDFIGTNFDMPDTNSDSLNIHYRLSYNVINITAGIAYKF